MKFFNTKRNKLFLEQIKSKIKKADVISFDIFDTLLVRPYIKPTDLFIHMEKVFECPGFEAERRDAERICRIRHRELEDITLDMIYDEIDNEYKHMKQKEMDWEEMVLRANPELKQVYDYAQKLGKKIIIASDMYIPSEFLAKVLRKNGYDNWDKLYVSGELGLTKGHGSLWKKIFEDFSIQPKQMLHIGDNVNGDFNKPKSQGANAALYTQVLKQYLEQEKKAEDFVNKTSGRLGASILVACLAAKWQEDRSNKRRTDYWSRLGYNYAGPLNYAYARFVENDVKQNDINNVMFVAREGYILKQIFEKFNTGIKTNYVYAQRAFNLLCRLDYKNIIYQTSFIVNYLAERNSTIKDLLLGENLVTTDDYDNFIKKYYHLFQNEADKYSKRYANYIANKYEEGDKIAVVADMGSSFSALRFLRSFVGQGARGVFFVNSARFLDDNNTAWAHTCFNKKRIFSKTETDIFTKNWDLVEFLMSAPEVSTNEIDENGNPVYEGNVSKYELARQKIYPQVVDSAINFADEILNLFAGKDIYIDYLTIVEWFNAFIDNPEKEDVKKWGSIYFFRLIGNKAPSASFALKISPFEYLFEIKKTKEKLANITWKTKFQKFYLKNWGIYKKRTRDTDIKRFFGITLRYKVQNPYSVERKHCFGLIKIIKTFERNKCYLLGIKIRDKQNNLNIRNIISLLDQTVTKFQRSLTIAFLHQKTFGEFRNKHNGETLALVGAGPTVKFLEPLSGVKYVGLNRAFLQDKVKFDYLFTIDKAGLDTGKEQFYDGFLNYDCIKFVGDQNLGKAFQHPQSIMYGDDTIRRYKTTSNLVPCRCTLDIDTEPLGNSCSCSVQAMQFILFTNPKRVYIYGIDCSCASGQHFIGGVVDNKVRGENAKNLDAAHVKFWHEIKEFAETYYPETEIIVVNPVGLKGIFKDVYTKSYLKKHPEINPDLVEILENDTISV